MNPVSVLRMLWHHKFSMLSVLMITLVAGSYVYFFAPRNYSASSIYVLVNPKIPSAEQLLKEPALAALNADNPYLRSVDSSLITQVMVTRLSSVDTVDAVTSAGLSPDYTVTLPSASGAGQLIRLEATGSSPAKAISAAELLGQRLTEELRATQKVNGADDLYLFTALQIDPPNKATEQYSSRLRSLVVVLIAGVILTFAAVSAARVIESSRTARAAVSGGGRTREPERARHAANNSAAADEDAEKDPMEMARQFPAGNAQNGIEADVPSRA
ncbi:MAG: chain-length determining protein [Arthrobacter sp.]|nr:chain-length determining protein [Arthrobacter sp.]MDZ4354383.1 chain-length determining protein [Arthrobacter sp.]